MTKKRSEMDGLRKKLHEEKAKMDAALNQLVESDSWPVGGGASSLEEERRVKKEAEDTKELVETAKELSERLNKMWELAQAREDEEGKKKNKGKGKAKAEDEDPMDVDSDSNDGPSKKRQGSSEDDSTAEQYEEMLEKLNQLESTLFDLENEFNQHRDSMHDNIVHLLDSDSKNYRETKEAVAVSDETAAMLDNVSKMDGEIREIDDALVELLTTSREMDQKIKDLQIDSTNVNRELMIVRQFLSLSSLSNLPSPDFTTHERPRGTTRTGSPGHRSS